LGLGKVTRSSIIHANMHKPNNKLVSVELEHLLVHEQAMGKHGLTRLTTA
jgi:hypothetical protein